MASDKEAMAALKAFKSLRGDSPFNSMVRALMAAEEARGDTRTSPNWLAHFSRQEAEIARLSRELGAAREGIAQWNQIQALKASVKAIADDAAMWRARYEMERDEFVEWRRSVGIAPVDDLTPPADATTPPPSPSS